MALAQNLEKCFHLLTQGKEYTQEELMMKLEDALILCNRFSLVDHSIWLCYREKKEFFFPVNQSWVSTAEAGSQVKCIGGNLLFVVYSPQKDLCRVFLIQNKLKRNTEFKNRFYTDLLELDSLSHIRGDGEVASVANCGVFYRKDDSYDCRFYSAELCTPLQEVGVEPQRVVVFRGNMDQRRISRPNCIEDYEGISSLRKFGQAIEEMRIGQPVSGEWLRELLSHIPAKQQPWGLSGMAASLKGEFSWKNQPGEFLDSVKTIVFINIDEK